MRTDITSNVAFKSNLQLVKGSIREDKHFLSSIHDPFALVVMKKTGYEAITSIQKEEYDSASLHCAYAYKDDYPWGTIIDSEGRERVVCKCTNISCTNFTQCRLDFDTSELEISTGNIRFQAKAQEIIKAIDEGRKSVEKFVETGDAIASSSLFGGKISQQVNPVVFQKSPASKIDHSVYATKPSISFSYTTRPSTASYPRSTPTTKSVKGPKLTPVLEPVVFNSFVEVEQKDIIELASKERTVVNAGPGTGKTWTLIEKIKYMLLYQDVEPEEILVLCFSRAAVEVVRTRLEDAAIHDELPLNWHEVDVRTFDSFATYLLAWVQENMPDLLRRGYKLETANYEQRIIDALSVIQNFTDLLVQYKHVIVDEVQDLVGVRAEMVLALLGNLPETCGFTILGDACQSLYDYLSENDNTVMNSEQFYQSIFRKYTKANYFSLTHNYRQGDEFGTFSELYRKAILTGSAKDRVAEAQKIASSLPSSDTNLIRFSVDDAAKYLKEGDLGILTRTNGQALQISSWLRAGGINHSLQKPLTSQELASWIGRVLMNAETDVINVKEFTSIFAELYPDRADLVSRYWNALISTQRDQTKRHYEIENILRGMMQNARNPLLFEEPAIRTSNITVSNIHRAKGREFDSVLVIEDVLEAVTDENEKDVLEHKVCYVALTRPKKIIKKASLKKQYIYISKDKIRRCFMAGGFRRRYLSHFEVGDSSDVNMRSYASNSSVQEYIQQLPVDSRLMFIRCPKETESYVIYKIVPEDNEKMVLGYTTAAFACDIEKAIQRIFKSHRSIDFKYYPENLNDIYLNSLNTCISATDSGIDGAKKIGDMYLWFGLDSRGFAQSLQERN